MWKIGVSQAMESDATPSLPLSLTENALGERRLLRLGKKWVCQPRECTACGERGCSRLAPNRVKSPMPGARAGGGWQVKKGAAMSLALCICCLAKSSGDLPHSVLQMQVLCRASLLAFLC